jgi:3-deoxy-D-manno-octulosonic-acid transferase
LIELEIWPNFLVAAHERGIPVAIVNGRISERSVRVLKTVMHISSSFKKAIKGAFYCARSKADACRFLELGIDEERVLVTGNIKYDSLPVEECPEERERLSRLFNIGPDDLVLVGGSTHPGEEEILLRVFKTLKPELQNLRLILVPRHIERVPEVEETVVASGLPYLKRSKLSFGETDESNKKVIPSESESIIIVDTVGELEHIYSLAHCVFVGKSLKGVGGQNVMEPAGLGRPIIFGPHTENFLEESNLLLESGGARKVNNEGELLEAVRDSLTCRQLAEAMGQRAREAVLKHRGATQRSINVLKRLIKGEKD